MIIQAFLDIIIYMNPQTYVFFGTAGSGKGTQAELLAKVLKEKHEQDAVSVSLGAEFRKLIGAGNYTSQVLAESINKGNYQPDFITDSVFLNFLFNNFDPEKNLITDGYPRTVGQAQFLEKAMSFYGRTELKIINLAISADEVIRRMKLRARADDTDEGIKKRFSEHEKGVLPAIEYFKNKSEYDFYEINGEQSVEDVHKDIVKALGL